MREGGDLQEWEWLVANGLFIHARGQRVRGGVEVSDAVLMIRYVIRIQIPFREDGFIRCRHREHYCTFGISISPYIHPWNC